MEVETLQSQGPRLQALEGAVSEIKGLLTDVLAVENNGNQRPKSRAKV